MSSEGSQPYRGQGREVGQPLDRSSALLTTAAPSSRVTCPLNTPLQSTVAARRACFLGAPRHNRRLRKAHSVLDVVHPEQKIAVAALRSLLTPGPRRGKAAPCRRNTQATALAGRESGQRRPWLRCPTFAHVDHRVDGCLPRFDVARRHQRTRKAIVSLPFLLGTGSGNSITDRHNRWRSRWRELIDFRSPIQGT